MAGTLICHYIIFLNQCSIFLETLTWANYTWKTHRLALAIAKETLDENRFTATQKTISRDNPAFQVGDHVYFKNKQPGKWDLKWRPGYQIVRIECNGHFIYIENQATGKT